MEIEMDSLGNLVFYVPAAVFLLVLVASAVRILREYE